MGVYTALCVKITYTTKTWNKLPKKNNEKLGNYKVWFSCLNFLFPFLIIPVPPICQWQKTSKGEKELFRDSSAGLGREMSHSYVPGVRLLV